MWLISVVCANDHLEAFIRYHVSYSAISTNQLHLNPNQYSSVVLLLETLPDVSFKLTCTFIRITSCFLPVNEVLSFLISTSRSVSEWKFHFSVKYIEQRVQCDECVSENESFWSKKDIFFYYWQVHRHTGVQVCRTFGQDKVKGSFLPVAPLWGPLSKTWERINK